MATTKTSPSKVISLTELKTGRILLTTEAGVYELDAHGVFNPMSFTVEDPPAPAAEPAPAPEHTA